MGTAAMGCPGERGSPRFVYPRTQKRWRVVAAMVDSRGVNPCAGPCTELCFSAKVNSQCSI